MERKVLGRGLDALIPQDTQGFKERVQSIKVELIQASPYQPRLNFSHEKIQELAQSIREKGVIQPILVRSLGGDQFELIAGERRLRAVKQLGLDEIPAIVRRVPDADVLEMAIIENIQREELNPLDEAKAYKRLSSEFGVTQESIAKRVGKDKSSISNLLRVLNLPEKIQSCLADNLITLGHAKALLSIGDAKRQIDFCEKIVQKGLSVRQAEQLGEKKISKRVKPAFGADSHISRVEEGLQHALGTKVRVIHGKKRGRIEIDYYSLDDLDRVLRLLGVEVS